MGKYIVFILCIAISFNACNNPYEKEIGEVEGLLLKVKDAEEALFSVDTSKVFTAKRQMEKDLAEFNKIQDTLTKEEAFRMADIFGSKKKLFRLKTNYPNFIGQLELSKMQLTNMKQDLENGIMKKEDFKLHFATEQAVVMQLGSQINKSVNGLDIALQKLELDRSDFLDFVEKRKLKAAENE